MFDRDGYSRRSCVYHITYVVAYDFLYDFCSRVEWRKELVLRSSSCGTLEADLYSAPHDTKMIFNVNFKASFTVKTNRFHVARPFRVHN